MTGRKARRWAEVFLLLAGLTGVGIWGWSYVRLHVFQSLGNQALDRRIASRQPSAPQAHVSPPIQIQNGALIGRLEIPRLNMRAVVREGAGQDTLSVALGHIPGTAFPGESGNAGIAGHRDTLFRGLRKIEKDDVIQFQTPNGSYNYRVESTNIVKPDNVAVLRAGRNPELTLVTCYPFYYVGSAPDRFIVKASLVEAQTPPVAATQPATTPVSTPAAKPAVSGMPPKSTVQRVGFKVYTWESREVVPGIRLGVSQADAVRRRATVRMFVTPERHTITLKNQPAHQAVFFHGHDDGKQRELMITGITANSVTGYLLLYGSARTPRPSKM
ncbi:MAG: class D sortase [Bryobacteraceae bacterium]